MRQTKRYLSLALSAIMVLALFATFFTATVSAASTNIAPQATFTPPSNVQFPERLTDGVKLTGGYDAACKSFSGSTQTGAYIFSFDELKTIQKVEVAALGGTGIQDGNGSQTTQVKVYASTDSALEGANFTEVAVIDHDGTGWQSFVKEFTTPVSARHLKFHFTNSHGNTYAHAQIQEIEIYAAAPSVPTGPVVKTNVASQATITVKGIVGNGIYDATRDVNHLTDGVKLTGGYNTSFANFATSAKGHGIILSFDEIKDFYEFKISALGGEGDQDGSASRTKTVRVYASTAAAAPTESAAWGEAIATVEYDGTNSWQEFVAALDAPVSARHLKFSLVYTGSDWAYTHVQEIEAYAGSTASTGDNGVVALGIIAFVALAGVAVCTKRNLNK